MCHCAVVPLSCCPTPAIVVTQWQRRASSWQQMEWGCSGWPMFLWTMPGSLGWSNINFNSWTKLRKMMSWTVLNGDLQTNQRRTVRWEPSRREDLDAKERVWAPPLACAIGAVLQKVSWRKERRGEGWEGRVGGGSKEGGGDGGGRRGRCDRPLALELNRRLMARPLGAARKVPSTKLRRFDCQGESSFVDESQILSKCPPQRFAERRVLAQVFFPNSVS